MGSDPKASDVYAGNSILTMLKEALSSCSDLLLECYRTGDLTLFTMIVEIKGDSVNEASEN
ncbi:hypothetical protein E4U55_002065 [Claviceps digitariae]|nr:hypothetical protein E4U55_002065 [Claviceps digitariae]